MYRFKAIAKSISTRLRFFVRSLWIWIVKDPEEIHVVIDLLSSKERIIDSLERKIARIESERDEQKANYELAQAKLDIAEVEVCTLGKVIQRMQAVIDKDIRAVNAQSQPKPG